AFRRFRIAEPVGLVRSLVYCGAAQLCEPDRLRARRPFSRQRLLDAAPAIVVRVLPPAAQILAAENPWLAVCPIRDGRADTRLAVGGTGIVPVEALAARNRIAQCGDIMRACGAVRVAAGMILVAPVGDREIIVNADGIDRGR